MARLGTIFFFFFMDVEDQAIYHVLIHFSYLLIPEETEEKPLGLDWNQTQVLLLHR